MKLAEDAFIFGLVMGSCLTGGSCVLMSDLPNRGLIGGLLVVGVFISTAALAKLLNLEEEQAKKFSWLKKREG